MKNLLLIIVIAILLTGCSKEEFIYISPPDDRIPFEINFLQYSENNYFIDEVYSDTSIELNSFNRYYGNIIPEVLTKYIVKDIEVYITVNTIGSVRNSIIANAYINLTTRSYSTMYSDLLRQPISDPIPGQEETALFRKLDEGSDYIFHPEIGYIIFLFPIEPEDVIAAAYRIENDLSTDTDDLFYGEFMSELVNNSKTTGVLKLIKPRNLQPNYETAWKLKMRNIYQLEEYAEITNLDLDIFLVKPDSTVTNSINNIRLLELFGFDRYDSDGNPNPDGKFDNRNGFNYLSRTAELIFPVIQPFGNNIPSGLNDYKYMPIYDTTRTSLYLPDYHFIIRGKYKIR